MSFSLDWSRCCTRFRHYVMERQVLAKINRILQFYHVSRRIFVVETEKNPKLLKNFAKNNSNVNLICHFAQFDMFDDASSDKLTLKNNKKKKSLKFTLATSL